MAPKNIFLLFLLFTLNSVNSQSNNNTTNPTPAQLNPSMTIIVFLLITLFFFIGFLSIYIRRCGGANRDVTLSSAAAAAAARIRIPQGLHANILEKFPTLIYSEVKNHKIGKGELECAICINEFEDDETIRILPVCDHVFHVDCIDAWLASHVTCPVCRANYVSYSPAEAAVTLPPEDPAARDIEEMRELARIASKRRGKSNRNMSRSHSAGNLAREGEGGLDRYTLRLPENLRAEIFATGKMRRARTFAAAVSGEGGIRRGRSIYLGRSDRRPSFFGRSDRRSSFFGRSVSLRIPTFGNRSRRFGGVGGEGYSDEGSTVALNRMV